MLTNTQSFHTLSASPAVHPSDTTVTFYTERVSAKEIRPLLPMTVRPLPTRCQSNPRDNQPYLIPTGALCINPWVAHKSELSGFKTCLSSAAEHPKRSVGHATDTDRHCRHCHSRHSQCTCIRSKKWCNCVIDTIVTDPSNHPRPDHHPFATYSTTSPPPSPNCHFLRQSVRPSVSQIQILKGPSSENDWLYIIPCGWVVAVKLYAEWR